MNTSQSNPSTPATSSSRRILGRIALSLALGVATVCVSGRACAGWDDFEFGQKLIDKGYIEDARKVFTRILGDDKRNAQDKERARYGMALLGKAEVIASARNPKTPFKEVVEKMSAAVGSIDEFVQKSGDDPKADEARFESGSLRQWFVKWASDLAADKDLLTARATTAEDTLAEARKQMTSTVETYDNLRKNAKKASDKDLAEYFYVITQYFRGLVFPKCSSEARDAFIAARKALDDYASAKDGYLTSVFAQDFLGLTFQELGDCNQSADPKDDRWKDYGLALEWFVSCAGTADESDDHRKILTQGYLHVGQLANHAAGDVLPISESNARKILQAGRKHLSAMTKQAPRAIKMPSGILALIEWALIEWKLENAGEAIQILKQASDYAQASGFDDVRNRANSVLGIVVAGGGSSGGTADPGVVSKVAEDLYGRGKYAEAVAAYQRVIAAAPRTPEALKNFVYPSWSRIAQAYANLKLPVEAATAYDVLVDEVRGGRIVGVGEGDKTTRLASDAMDREASILKELSVKTGDPSLKDRMNRFLEDMIALKKKLGDVGSSTGDLAYRRARDLFEEGGRQKGVNDAASKKAFADSKAFFLETAKNLKSEYQDAAWVYLCRVALELGDYDGVVKAADEALAYWDTPEAKKRLETDDKIRRERPTNLAAITYWRAAAQHEAKHDDKSLEILDTFVAKFGKSAGDYRGRALGLRVEILAASGKIEEAERAFDDLVKEVPDYYRMYQILVILGGYYQKQSDEIQKKIDVNLKEWLGTAEDRASGVKAKLFDAERNEQRLVAVLSDLNQSIDTHEKWLAEYGEKPDKQTEADIHRKELARKRTQKTEADAALAKVREEIGTNSKRRDELQAARAALQKEQAPPMRRTAEIYKKLDDVLKGLDKAAGAGAASKRRAENVAGLAYRYFLLARGADLPADWALARDLYEDYLAFPEVKAAAETLSSKRFAQRFLGETYYHIAQAAKSPEERRTAFANAVKYLQASLARNPVNLPIVVAHLSGELPVLPFADLRTERTWRFPVPKVADAAAFREYVKNLTPDRLPRYLNDATQTQYEKALADFQRKIKDLPEDDAKRAVKSLQNAGFDHLFFAEHGLTDNDFLLALARAYARSGIAENEVRAVNAADVVLAGPSRPVEDTAEWWEAKTTKLEVLLAIAERASAATGDASGEAKIQAQAAERFMFSTWQMNPRIGGPERGPETLKEWQDLQVRVNAVLSRLGLTPQALDLTKVPASAPIESTTPETPAAPPGMAEAPPAPAGAPPPAAPAMEESAPAGMSSK